MLKAKWHALLLRARDIARLLPRRSRRLGQHLANFCPQRAKWWLELYWLIFDLVGLPECYETLVDWFKWRSRPLSPTERAILYPIFGESLNYERVRIDEGAWLGPPQWRICYVSFYTINSWGNMSAALLVHEMVHIWQFEQVGSVYIPRALQAQRSAAGYNYGGPLAVSKAVKAGWPLLDFNYEQQADLVADYWRLQQGQRVQWGPAGPADLPNYLALVKQFRHTGKHV